MKENIYILIALLKATIEQQTAIKGSFKGRSKQLFNLWYNQSGMLLNELEGKNELNDNHIQAITDVLHDTMDEIKKQITPKEK